MEEIKGYIMEGAAGILFEDIAGRDYWKRLLGSYAFDSELDEALQLEYVQCFLLYGPFGSGKNTLIQAVAGEMELAGYRYLEVDMEKVPVERQAALFNLIWREYICGKPCFLFLNHVQETRAAAALWNLVNEAETGEIPLIMAAASEENEQLIPDVRKLFQAYYIGLPDEDDRRAYFEMMIESLFSKLSMQSRKLLVEGTKGFDYIQMESLVRQIKLLVKRQILQHEKDMIIALSWLDADLVKEVLSYAAPVEKKESQIEELLTGIRSIVAMQPMQELSVQASAGMEGQLKAANLQDALHSTASTQIQETQRTPLDDLRSRLGPHKVFDKGVMLAKKEN